MIVSGALITPFSAAVAALQYLDQRIRKEGYDIQLIAQVRCRRPRARRTRPDGLSRRC